MLSGNSILHDQRVTTGFSLTIAKNVSINKYKLIFLMDPIDIIKEFYKPDSFTYNILLQHGQLVAQKALAIARRVPQFKPDVTFIYEAAMLHDIGIFLIHAPRLGCRGRYPYLCHGVLGGELLEKSGFSKHALVCERHVGIGITAKEIKSQGLPLPERDMAPCTIEEQIICFADKFFSKTPGLSGKEKSIGDIKQSLKRYGPEKIKMFDCWVKLFRESDHEVI